MKLDAEKLKSLRWIKYVSDLNRKDWVYQCSEDGMELPEEKIFRLHWNKDDARSNPEAPKRGDLMLLLQMKKVSHLVEFLEDSDCVYDLTPDKWGMHRIVKALWVSPGVDWAKNVPTTQEVLGYEDIAKDGLAHRLDSRTKMYQFRKRWAALGDFQAHVLKRLNSLPSA